MAYCRAVLNAPPLVLADEPTGNLDDRHAAVILAELRGLCRERGTSVILVTHRADAAARADRALHHARRPARIARRRRALMIGRSL